MHGRCTVELLILGFGSATVQEWAKAEECYLGYAINGPINKIWKIGIDRGPIAIIRNVEIIDESEEQAEIVSCHSSYERFGLGTTGNLSKDMLVEFEVEGYWAYCYMRPRYKIGCEGPHEEMWRWRNLDQQDLTKAGTELYPAHSMRLFFITCSQSSPSSSLKRVVTNILVTMHVESKLINESGILYSLMRKEGNFSTLSVFKVFLKSWVNLS